MSVGIGSSKQPTSLYVYRFRWELLEPGDVICSTIPSDGISRLIRTVTWSAVSHISMCVEPKGCIEANESVARFSVLHVGCRDPKNVKVLRLRDSIPNSRGIRAAAAAAALSFLGQKYWTVGALKSLFPWLPPSEQPGAFCSHLVASAYKAANLEIKPDKSAQYITPKAIANCDLFEDVSNQVLEEILADHVNTHFEYLDEPRNAHTPHLEENELSLKVCADVATSFQHEINKSPRSLMEAQVLIVEVLKLKPDLAERLSDALYSSLRKVHFAEEMIRLAPREPLYDPDALVAWLLTDAATRSDVDHVLSECINSRSGSDRMLQERLDWWNCYEVVSRAGFQFGTELATVCKYLYEVYKSLLKTNDLCINILNAFLSDKDFVALAPSGDPRKLLALAGEEQGTFVLQADSPEHEARKYFGKLIDCAHAYVRHLGSASQRISVRVWQERDDGLNFIPPPPMKEGSWWIEPPQVGSSEAKDLGPTKVPDNVTLPR